MGRRLPPPPRLSQAQSAGGLVTDQEVRAALAGPDVTVPCLVCRPDTVLQHNR
ncbi:DUF6233 domain-containing protein [Streptomyces lydicus]|uniref:DUF6233 domain-containing protein n=1 Tax=Streptomyces lydicus TaxID=47763 RepID=UPI00240D4F41|nr:DUF6233 domain-containing protein [Streptomyces lydicus]